MTPRDWLTPEGRAELRRLFSGGPDERLEFVSASPDAVPMIEAALAAALPLLDALEAAERERDRLHEEMTAPTCMDCCAVLGDNWCADCAGKIDRDKLAAAEARVQVMRAALAGFSAPEYAQLHEWARLAGETARQALTNDAQHGALDALLAEARREGALACVEAARGAWGFAAVRCGDTAEGTVEAERVFLAVERAAAEIGAAKEKP